MIVYLLNEVSIFIEKYNMKSKIKCVSVYLVCTFNNCFTPSFLSMGYLVIFEFFLNGLLKIYQFLVVYFQNKQYKHHVILASYVRMVCIRYHQVFACSYSHCKIMNDSSNSEGSKWMLFSCSTHTFNLCRNLVGVIRSSSLRSSATSP
jgi:hypothetical protein